jgi:secreted trypsin-like serine protease
MKISHVYCHPKFDPDTYDYDVALLELETSVGDIAPLQVIGKQSDAMTRTGYRWVAGWGRLGEARADLPDILQEVKVTISDIEDCRADYQKIGREITPRMFCAQGNAVQGGVADPCQGDSGGPMVSRDNFGEDPVLIGIISKGAGCGRRKYPGVYTRLSELRDWVDGCKNEGKCDTAG